MAALFSWLAAAKLLKRYIFDEVGRWAEDVYTSDNNKLKWDFLRDDAYLKNYTSQFSGLTVGEAKDAEDGVENAPFH